MWSRLKCFLNGALSAVDLTGQLAAWYGNRAALQLEDSGTTSALAERSLTYAELHRITCRVAAMLRGAGVAPGSPVVVAASNQLDLLVAVLAVFRCGAIAVPLNDGITEKEIADVLQVTNARALWLDDAVYNRLLPSLLVARSDVTVFASTAPGTPVPVGISVASCLAGEIEPAPPAPARPDAPCAILFTSGTTGLPKGAVHTPATLFSRMHPALLFPAGLARSVVMALPLAHMMGLVSIFLSLLAGATVHLMSVFHARRVLEVIERSRAEIFVGVPAMYRLMAEIGLDGFRLDSIHAWISAADHMPSSLIREFKRRGGVGLGRIRRGAFFVDVYGSVEAGGAVMFRVVRPSQSTIAEHFVGRLLPGCRARVVDEAGRSVRGTVGELTIRARSVLTGYLNDSTGVRTPGRWLHTGDLAMRDRWGAVHVLERNSNLIKSGGYSLFPAEIERVLAEHPDVSDAVAFGMCHRIKGDMPVAAVALRPGAGAESADLLTWASGRLADYKCPRQIFIVDASEIPRTPSHKIRRSLLAASVAAGVATEQSLIPDVRASHVTRAADRR